MSWPVVCAAVLFAAGASADPWPGGAGSEIGNVGGGGLPSGYEPSGAVWHPRLDALFVVGDEGQVSQLDSDGSNVTTWTPGGDIEAVTIRDSQTDLIYLGIEHPDSVVEFDVGTGTLTGNSWDLTPWMTGPNGSGLEALTYVDGLFYAGLQHDGGMYVFDLEPAGVVSFIEVIASPFDRDDVSGLHYEPKTQILYAVHDSFDVIVEMDADGTFVREFDLPPDKQEGIALVPSCPENVSRVFISDDAGDVWRYDSYPVICPVPTVPTLSSGRLMAFVVALLASGAALSQRATQRNNGKFRGPRAAGTLGFPSTWTSTSLH